MQRKALGKGLSALIPNRPVTDQNPAGVGVREIPVTNIYPNAHQPRKSFNPESMADLVNSVKAKGLIQPVLVRERDGGFELIAGERRWRAAQKAGIISIPALVRKVSDQDSLELALIENIQRENLNPMESAEAYEKLIKEFRMTQEEVSIRVGKQRSTIANAMRLLSLPPELKGYVREEKLSAGHAKAILSLTKKAKQVTAGREIVRKGLSVREVEAMVRRVIAASKKPAVSRQKRDLHLESVESDLKRTLGTKVRILDRKDRGKIEIAYYSKKERERLISMLKNVTQT